MIRFCQVFILSTLSMLVFAQSYPAEVESYISQVKLERNKLITNKRVTIKINNRSGDKYCDVSIPYSELVKVGSIKAQIRDKSGRVVRRLSASEITDRSAVSGYSFYEDSYLKEFTLKHNSYPYYLDYSYQIKEKEFLYLTYWIPVIDYSIPTNHADLEVSIPRTEEINFKAQHTNSFVIDSSETNLIYAWKAEYTNVIGNEVLAPPKQIFIPLVKVTPLNFNFELPGSYQSWVTYGNWQANILKDLDDLPESEIIKANNLISGVDDKREQIRALYHYLQDETRYVNITIETGGLKPYPASYVARNKYGDCKALTNYFRCLLDAVGIPSYYTKVYAGEPIIRIDTAFPSQQFNHIILCIPDKQDTLWLDCTSKGPFGYLGSFTQNRLAFIVNDDDSSHFTKTPSLSPGEVKDTRTVNLSLKEPNNVAATFTINYRSEQFEHLSSLSKNYSENEQGKILNRYFVEDGFEPRSIQIINNHRDSTSITLKYEAVSNTLAKNYGSELIVELLPLQLPNLKSPENRKLPVQIDAPIFMEDKLTYTFSENYELGSIPNDVEISTEFGTYSLRFTTTENTIVVNKAFIMSAGYYETDCYSDLYEFVNHAHNIERGTKLVLNKTKQ